MALFNIDPETEYNLQGKVVSGVTISQGNNVVFIPTEIVTKIQEMK